MFPHCFMHEIHTGTFPVRSVLIRGERLQLIWDTLTHPQDLAALPVDPQKMSLVVYSHADWDHIQGTAAIQDALTIGHRACAKRFEHEAPRMLRELALQEPGKWDDVRLISPVITFEQELSLDLGAYTVHLRHLPGHTPDSIVAFIPQLQLLLAGDAAEQPCPCVPARCDLRQWIDALEYWARHTGVRHVVPSHGAIGGTEILTRTADYLKALAAGTPLPLPAQIDQFYIQTHTENLRHCGLAASGLHV